MIKVGDLIEAESSDGAWEELRVVFVERSPAKGGGSFRVEVTERSFGPLPRPTFFSFDEEGRLWRRKETPGLGRVRLLHQRRDLRYRSFFASLCTHCGLPNGYWVPMQECPARLSQHYRETIDFAERSLATMAETPKLVEVLAALRKALS